MIANGYVISSRGGISPKMLFSYDYLKNTINVSTPVMSFLFMINNNSDFSFLGEIHNYNICFMLTKNIKKKELYNPIS